MKKVYDGVYSGTYYLYDIRVSKTEPIFEAEAVSSADLMRKWLGEDYADYVKQSMKKGKTSYYRVNYFEEEFYVSYWWREGQGGRIKGQYADQVYS